MSKNQQHQFCRPGNLKCKNCNSPRLVSKNVNDNEHLSNSSSNSSSSSKLATISPTATATANHDKEVDEKIISNSLIEEQQQQLACALNNTQEENASSSAPLFCSNDINNSRLVNEINNFTNQNGAATNNQRAAKLQTSSTTTNNCASLLSPDSDNLNAANSMIKNSCIIERLGSLYLKNDSLSDVTFLLPIKPSPPYTENNSPDTTYVPIKQTPSLLASNQQQERIAAHKLILSIASPVFMAMFYGSGSQMQSTGSQIQIPDIDARTFKSMLKYMYTDELEIEPDSVMSTLYCAKKYAVVSLERECVDFLKCNLRADNAFMLLEQALLFDEQQLVELCLGLIDKSPGEAFAADCFLDVNLDTLILVLKRDSLGIREFNLLKHVLKWGQNKCAKEGILPINRDSQRLVLEEAIKYIRFPLMTREEFASAMQDLDSRVIDDKEIIDLFINLTLGEGEQNNFMTNCGVSNSVKSSFIPKKLIYSDKPRCCLGGKEEIVNRFVQVESRWGYSGTSDRVRFSVNRRVFIVGFGLYGSIYGKCEYSVVIQLIHYGSCTTCAQNSTSFVCDGTNSTFKVLFKEPVEIYPETDYIASATLKGPDSYYGTKGQRKVTHESQTDGKVTFNFQYASGNNNGTSVEDGQIPEIIFLYSPS